MSRDGRVELWSKGWKGLTATGPRCDPDPIEVASRPSESDPTRFEFQISDLLLERIAAGPSRPEMRRTYDPRRSESFDYCNACSKRGFRRLSSRDRKGNRVGLCEVHDELERRIRRDLKAEMLSGHATPESMKACKERASSGFRAELNANRLAAAANTLERDRSSP